MAQVASTTTATALLAARGRRGGVIIENSDANRLHVLIGSGTVSATNYSFSLAQYHNAKLDDYGGAISGVWAGDGEGFAHITEMP